MANYARPLGTDTELIQIMKDKGVEIADNVNQKTVNNMIKKMLHKVHIHNEEDGCYGYAQCRGTSFRLGENWQDSNGNGYYCYYYCNSCGYRTTTNNKPWVNPPTRCTNPSVYQLICTQKGMTQAEIDSYK